jgi:3'(2'), 5'-bisphosphate nucleotidase
VSGDFSSNDAIAKVLGMIAWRAGGVILDIVEAGVTHYAKQDDSPCSNADLAAEKAIVADLACYFPDVPVVAEESCGDFADKSPGPRFFLVDPVDGTRDFLAGTSEFTVNIALIEAGRPVAGAIYAPLMRTVWIGGSRAYAAAAAAGAGALPAGSWRPIAARKPGGKRLVALTSKRHRDIASEAFLDTLPIAERRRVSSSLKFCLIASGEADVYARYAPTMAWDIAAGDAILTAAGGCVETPAGAPIRYGMPGQGFVNGAFVAWGDATLAAGRGQR